MTRTITDHGAGERNWQPSDCRWQLVIKDETEVDDGQRRHYDNRITVADTKRKCGAGQKFIHVYLCVTVGPSARHRNSNRAQLAQQTHPRRQR